MLNKGSNDCEGVRFLQFYFPVYTLVLALIEKIHVHDCISHAKNSD